MRAQILPLIFLAFGLPLIAKSGDVLAQYESGPARSDGMSELSRELLLGAQPEDADGHSSRVELGSKTKRDEIKVHGELGRGITVDTGDQFSLRLGARVGLRYELSSTFDSESQAHELEHRPSVSNLRLVLGGHALTRSLTYRIQLNLSPLHLRGGQNSPVFDAYMNYQFSEARGLRFGQFFVPFNRLRTISDYALQLGSRSIAVREFSLHRDLGVRLEANQLFGKDSPLTLQLGAFAGDGTQDHVWKKPGALLTSRLELRPFGAFDDSIDGDLSRRKQPALALGAAFAANLNASKDQSNSGALLSEGLRHFLHASTDLIFKWRGFAFQTELIMRRSTVPSGLSGDRSLAEPTRDGYGATAQLSYLFFVPVEVVGRLAAIDAWKDAHPDYLAQVEQTGRELALGVNYYVRGHELKIQSDYSLLTPPGFPLKRANHLARIQIDASF